MKTPLSPQKPASSASRIKKPNVISHKKPPPNPLPPFPAQNTTPPTPSSPHTPPDPNSKPQPPSSPSPSSPPSPSPPPSQPDPQPQSFESLYLHLITAEFANDIDKVRHAPDFKPPASVALLVQALRAGAGGFGEGERGRIMRAGDGG